MHDCYHFPPYRLWPDRRLLVSGHAPVKLGGRAFDLLVALVQRRDRTVSRDELMELVWPRLVVEENNLQVQVVALRKLLGHPAIATVPGRGYRFTLPVQVEGGPADAVDGAAVSPAAGPWSVPAAPSTRTNLPHWMPPLHGRDESLASLLDAMSRSPWVTVTGPAGIGKTRLAQAAAARLAAGGLAGGVWWIDLAPLTDASLVPSSVALALGVAPDAAPDLTAAIAARLAAQPVLLALDNAEHLVDGVAAFLARLRPLAGALRVLVTCQEPLHGADEQGFRVEPLALPNEATLAAAQASGAVQLFVARAQAADRRFELNAANHEVVSDICRRLDGIPLAIELAAARLPLLGVDGLRARLDQRFQVLTVGDRVTSRRYRTLREAVEWSHQLLSPEEQAVFRRLGVFAGGFTLEAAQAVAEDDRGLDAWDVLEHLGRLVDKSLVLAEGEGVPRYRLLETLRLFALEKLIESGEADAVRTAHRAHFLDVAESARDALLCNQPDAIRVLDRERDNLLVALAWTARDPGGELCLRLAESLRTYWASRGDILRGLGFLRSALRHPDLRGVSLAHCKAEIAASAMSALAGELDQAVRHALNASKHASQLRDDGCLAIALATLGNAQVRQRRTDEAAQSCNDALSAARRSGGDHELGHALSLASDVHALQGRLDLARAAEEENLLIRRRLGQVRNVANAHLGLAWIATELGEADMALRHLVDAMHLTRRIDSEYHGVMLMRMVSHWMASRGRFDAAVTMRSAFEAHAARIGLNEPVEPAEADWLRRAGERLPADEAAQYRQSGRQLQYVEVMQLLSQILAADDL
jgi:predicted ATPase/DNA-binding winged helix-turn-helix (wHTH) protein